ncbi:MAG: hypothetical protein II540_03550, partial [Paludibacteraceae bacterium]|nr:hypothetical protein [Paludibacteraceae bacterium]
MKKFLLICMTVICATCMSLFAQERTTKASQYPQATIVKKYSPLTKATGWYYDKSADEWVDGDRQIFAGNYWKNKKLAEGTNLPTFENISVIEVTYDGKTYTATNVIELDALGHNIIPVKGQAATTQASGYLNYFECERCHT